MEPRNQYTLVDPLFYEDINVYQPRTTDFIAFVKDSLSGWSVEAKGFWCHCRPPQPTIGPSQGWKIHLSATFANGLLILSSVLSILRKENCTFKFVADRILLNMQGGKQWPRGNAGKFVTIYPSSKEQFASLIDSLYAATLGYNGPYILSDKRYKDSKVVFYRYGAFVRSERLASTGTIELVMRDPTGNELADERNPYFTVPPWESDPFPSSEEGDNQEEATLHEGRYLIKEAKVITNSGGVYLAEDRHTGKDVIIKEARPFTNCTSSGTDAVSMLVKEYRLLSIIKHLNIAPQPLQLFREWEHLYLVETCLEAQVLRYHMSLGSLALKVAPSEEDRTAFLKKYSYTYKSIAQIMEVLHAHGIIFQDWSHYNVMASWDGTQFWLIDFEGAIEEGVDLPVALFTETFAEPFSRDSRRLPSREGDAFGLGSLMYAGIMPVNGLVSLTWHGGLSYLDSICGDLGLPSEIPVLIKGLLERNRDLRSTAQDAISVLSQDLNTTASTFSIARSDDNSIDSTIDKVFSFTLHALTPERADRCVPAGPEVFQTNGFNVAYGVAGVMSTWKHVKGCVPSLVSEWLRTKPVDPTRVPTGLYTGIAGIAWSLWECGDKARAAKMLKGAHSFLREDTGHDLFSGHSGWGLTQLFFFLETGDEEFLSRAVEAAECLRLTALWENGAPHWPVQGTTAYGMAHGASGVALFLLYLGAVLNSNTYTSLCLGATRFELEKAVERDDGSLTFIKDSGNPVRLPYWRWGTAGVMSLLVRLKAHYNTTEFDLHIERMTPDLARKYTIFPGRFFGLAGIGESLLDAYQFTGYSHFRDLACKVASGVQLFCVDSVSGVAFPGEELSRLSCDYGTGSIGIASFLHRLRNDTPSLFHLDQVFANTSGRVAK